MILSRELNSHLQSLWVDSWFQSVDNSRLSIMEIP